MTKEEEYDIINEIGWDEFDDKALDAIEEQIEETDLPKLVRVFEKTAVKYSRYNHIPAILGYYAILGDLVKHMVEIPYENTTTDTRIHIADIQTARSGKSTLINYVLKPVTEELYERLELDNKILTVVEYTTKSLVGSYIENTNFKTDAEEKLTKAQDSLFLRRDELNNNRTIEGNERVMRQNSITQELDNALELYEKTKDKWIIEYGPLHGEGIWFADEFENSGIFEKNPHKTGMVTLFQQMINNFHNGSNIYDSVLTGKPVIPLDSKYTITAWTYPPDLLLEVIMKKGICQRFLMFVWEVEDDILTDMRKKVTGGFGKISTVQHAPKLADGIIEVYNLLKERFESVGRDKLRTIVYHPMATDSIEMEHDNLLRYIDGIDPNIRKIIRLFEMNLIEYIGKLAVLNCITMANSISDPEGRFIVYPQNVRQGASIVRKCYITLVEWLEDALRQNSNVRLQKSNLKEFQHAYEVAMDRAKPSEKLEGSYVWKTLFLETAAKTLKTSVGTVRTKLRKISEMFEEKKKDNSRERFIRPKGGE